VARDKRPQERNPYSDCHFTVLGFTTRNGVPIMCAVIAASRQSTALEVSGINYLSDNLLEPGILEENVTKDEDRNGCEWLFLMGPKCDFEGKDVPCFVYCSENGSLIIHLLSMMIKRMDNLDSCGPLLILDPFLLCDGHGSRFDLPFLEYIKTS
jgi:hypothetical protein